MQSLKRRGYRRLGSFTAVVNGDTAEESFKETVTQTLNWLSRRARVDLPDSVWDMEAYDNDTPDNHIRTLRVDPFENNPNDYWYLDYNHSCTEERGRMWRLVVCAANLGNEKTVVRLNLGASHYVDRVRHIGLTVPNIFKNLSTSCGLSVDGKTVTDKPTIIRTNDADASSQMQFLQELMEAPDRTCPVVVITLPNGSSIPETAAINPNRLAKIAQGMAHTFVISNQLANDFLVTKYGKYMSVFNGAVRVYNPDFRPFERDPGYHPLFLAKHINDDDTSAENLENAIRDKAFQLSVELRDSAYQLPLFSDAQRELSSRRAKLSKAHHQGLKGSKLAESLRAQIAEKDQTIETLQTDCDEALETAVAEEQRAIDAEEQLEKVSSLLEIANAEIDQMRRKLGKPGTPSARVVGNVSFPDVSEIENWAQLYLGERVVLHPNAIKTIKGTQHERPELIFQSLLALGNEYWAMRASEKAGSSLLQGFQHAIGKLGLDESSTLTKAQMNKFQKGYTFEFGRRPVCMDRHLKGNNSRRDSRVFRVYFNWDQNNKRVLVGHMPTHLRNSMT